MMYQDLENQKASLEIQKLKKELGFWGRFSNQIWPIIGTGLPILLSAVALFVSLNFQHREQEQKHKEALMKAVELATDPQGKADRRVAAIWELNQFWDTHSKKVTDEQVLVANTLAAELTLGDDYRVARCAAAEVIGNAEGPEAQKGGKLEAFARTLTQVLYGKSTGEVGVVVSQHLLLRSSQPGALMAYGYSTTPDPGASNRCMTALDATREAIRHNWGYLRDVNLNGTDLSRIQLYEADLAGTSLRSAYVDHANFRCANLSNADFTSVLDWKDADFSFAVVTNAKPPDFVDYATHHGANSSLTDAQWLRWRDHNFLVKGGEPNLEGKEEGQDGSRCGKAELPPVELK